MSGAKLSRNGTKARHGANTTRPSGASALATLRDLKANLQRWRATDNALEAMASQHCDGLLILDELAQVDAKTAGEFAYMLANEAGKSRATRTGTPRARQTWRLLFLSAGEVSLQTRPDFHQEMELPS